MNSATSSTTAFTRDQLARLAFVVFYSPVLCAPQNIKAVADEIDCCPGCDHVSSGGTCHVSERGDYCPNDLAHALRQISVALYGPGVPSHYVESVFGPDHMPALSPSPYDRNSDPICRACATQEHGSFVPDECTCDAPVEDAFAWQPWFAWHPVRLLTLEWVWLRPLRRRRSNDRWSFFGFDYARVPS